MAPAPTPAPPGGAPKAGAGKRLPLWVWLAAGAAGLLVGLLLLRRTPQEGQTEEPTESVEGAGKPGGGGGGAGAPPDLLQSLGLTPPTDMGYDGGWDYGSWETGGGEQAPEVQAAAAREQQYNPSPFVQQIFNQAQQIYNPSPYVQEIYNPAPQQMQGQIPPGAGQAPPPEPIPMGVRRAA